MPRKKVALLFVCINQPYWAYLPQVMADAKKFFLLEHDVEILSWTDMPEETSFGKHTFHTDPITWPMGTLFRYHLFLKQEELLAAYDYIFYMDVDMRIVAPITGEIMGDGLTMAEHPMYALKKGLYPPYEPNNDSTAYIKRFGTLLNDEKGKVWFKPLYAAGGFQGGKASAFIKAMKVMKKNIDTDFQKNYIAIWNDESHWNKYLADHPPAIVLSPSYIYPDSLIKEYYEPIWGCSYQPKIVTLTKPFTVSKEGGDAVRKMLGLPDPVLGSSSATHLICPQCQSRLDQPDGFKILKIETCEGPGATHKVQMTKV